jgi:hypothetical protein
MIKKILLALLVLLLIIQFFKPEKNESDDRTADISTKYEVPEKVTLILKNACNDCHSNRTRYPWYANVQPVAWWLDEHIKDGKRGLNFSEFVNLPIAVQNHKFDEIVEVIEENEMPLASYTYLGLHPDAKLSEEEKDELKSWARNQMALLKATYPADSLVMKRRKKTAD